MQGKNYDKKSCPTNNITQTVKYQIHDDYQIHFEKNVFRSKLEYLKSVDYNVRTRTKLYDLIEDNSIVFKKLNNFWTLYNGSDSLSLTDGIAFAEISDVLIREEEFQIFKNGMKFNSCLTYKHWYPKSQGVIMSVYLIGIDTISSQVFGFVD